MGRRPRRVMMGMFFFALTALALLCPAPDRVLAAEFSNAGTRCFSMAEEKLQRTYQAIADIKDLLKSASPKGLSTAEKSARKARVQRLSQIASNFEARAREIAGALATLKNASRSVNQVLASELTRQPSDVEKRAHGSLDSQVRAVMQNITRATGCPDLGAQPSPLSPHRGIRFA